ncbi:MAG: signal peptidase II [Candidatus Dependentiae bacterium]|nr:signal peptidase II [Candidatus Dependentiae bacterium]
MTKKSTLYYMIMISTVLFVLDRFTKHLALFYCVPRCTLTPFLSFDLAFNRGISWGMFHTESTGLFYAITILIVGVTLSVAWHAYERLQSGHQIWGELLIITGSTSNILDRFIHAGVIDFIELSCGQWAWPLFNFADFYIVIGILIMLIPLYHE